MTESTEHAILVIDDEESLRLTFQLFLQRQGYNPVITASGLGEALNILASQPFDLIISDIVLEGHSGIDLLREVRARDLQCPVVMITGYPNVETASEAVRLGAFDYLPKPVDKETLLKTTRLALRQYHLEQEKLRAEQDNLRYHRFLETVFKSVSDGIITVDRDLQILSVNQAGKKMFRSLRPIRGQEIGSTSVCRPGEPCCLAQDARKVLHSGQEIREHRIECTAEGEPKVFSVCVSPLEDGDGSVNGVVIVSRDMSKEKEPPQRARCRFHRFIGQSRAMQAVYTMIENVGRVDTTVLLTGPSGTGKELAAEALHAESPRRDRPLIKVDCTAIPENLLESELFGHRRGAFTGADRDRSGRILKADGGTLFLDEIGNISTMVQLRLLRFLQEKTFYPVGGDRPVTVDVRVITATNLDLKRMVDQGRFREDLYFRLRVIDINLPALIEREGDIPLLTQHFLARISTAIGKEISGISDQAMHSLCSYSWPGNVRELEHTLERAAVLCNGTTISQADLPKELLVDPPSQGSEPDPTRLSTMDTSARHLSMAQLIIETLRRTGGNKAKAARLLGCDRSTLYRRIKEARLDLSALDL